MSSTAAPPFLVIVSTLVMLPAQQLVPATHPTVTLLPAASSVWQCEPIRCTLRVTAANGATSVRSYYSMDRDPWSPLQIERRHETEDRWLPVPPVSRRGSHPVRHLIAPPGKRMEAKQTLDYEVELWDLAVLSQPGTIRMRVVLKASATPAVEATWTEVATPWVEVEIRAHQGNAAALLGEDSATRMAELDRMSAAMNRTTTTDRNTGPHTPGPGTVTGISNIWAPHEPIAERLIADAKVSFRLRARARLVLAYSALNRALAADGDAHTAALRIARAHLDATEMVASPPSGGLDPLPSGGLPVLRLMLVACADGLDGSNDPRIAHRELCERYPFFAMWWHHEARYLLLR
jgi:hypothetical protein